MLDQLGALTVLQAAKTAHHPAHSPHIVKSVQQALDTYAIVEVCQLCYTVLYMDLSHCGHRASKPNRLPVVTTALLEFSKSWHPMERGALRISSLRSSQIKTTYHCFSKLANSSPRYFVVHRAHHSNSGHWKLFTI